MMTLHGTQVFNNLSNLEKLLLEITDYNYEWDGR